MISALDVLLGGIPVGRLSEDASGQISFRFLEDYRRLALRPVLSQSFEDDLERVYRGRRGQLPAFFANLVPEGPLRELIEASLQIGQGDEMGLLGAVGGDLPGAVELRPGRGEAGGSGGSDGDEPEEPLAEEAPETGLLRFSLAGVQLKFSVLREGDKLTLPVRGKTGDWIAKLDSSRFHRLVENELATLEWARAAGFEVPECHLETVASLTPRLREYAGPDGNVLVIRRYDRAAGGRRIHQEDFAQVVGLSPRRKYDHISYEQLARLLEGIAGPEAYLESVRRLAFVIASGNTDAHLKNWSIVYPDGANAVLSPLYDQVCTIAWPEVPPELALKFAGLRNLRQVDERAFERLAREAGQDPSHTVAVLHNVLERIAMAWRDSAAPRLMPREHAAILSEYWASAPLLRHLAHVIRA